MILNVNEYSTEALPQLEIQLKNIPEVLQYSRKCFKVSRVCSYRRGISDLRLSIGHYFALCKRGPHNNYTKKIYSFRNVF